MVPSTTVKLVQARFFFRERVTAFLLGTHSRAGKGSLIQKLAGKLNVLQLIVEFVDDPRRMRIKLMRHLRTIRNRESEDGNPCILDHHDAIIHIKDGPMTDEVRYPLACEERWGNSMGTTHCWEMDEKPGAPLSATGIQTHSPCMDCGADGEQYFSYCLNRFVNADRVHHCMWCGRCGYFRPGCMNGCEHCGMSHFDATERPVRFPSDARVSLRDVLLLYNVCLLLS